MWGASTSQSSSEQKSMTRNIVDAPRHGRSAMPPAVPELRRFSLAGPAVCGTLYWTSLGEKSLEGGECVHSFWQPALQSQAV